MSKNISIAWEALMHEPTKLLHIPAMWLFMAPELPAEVVGRIHRLGINVLSCSVSQGNDFQPALV